MTIHRYIGPFSLILLAAMLTLPTQAQVNSTANSDTDSDFISTLLNHPERLRVTSWDAANGLPEHYVLGLFEDSRGIVWLSHEFSISRWDGSSFHTVLEASASVSFSVNTIRELSDGSVWIYQQDVSENVSIATRLYPSVDRPCFIHTAPGRWHRSDDRILQTILGCATQGDGMAALDDNRLHLEKPVAPSAQLMPIWTIEAHDNGITVSSRSYSRLVDVPDSTSLSSMFVLPDSSLWMTLASLGVLVHPDGSNISFSGLKMASPLSESSVLATTDDERLVVIWKDGYEYVDTKIFAQLGVQAFNSTLRLQSGELLLATDAGLLVVDLPISHLISSATAQQLNARTLDLQEDGSVLVGTWGNGVFRLNVEDSTISRIPRFPSHVWAIDTALNGNVYTGTLTGIDIQSSTDSGQGLFLETQKIMRTLVADDSGVYTARTHDFVRIAAGSPAIQVVFRAESELWNAVRARDGRWLLSTKQGLEILTTDFKKVSRLAPNDFIGHVNEDARGLWLSTRKTGIIHISNDGRLTRLSAVTGLPVNAVWATHTDVMNRLWICADTGIYWIDEPVLRAFLSGQAPRIQLHKLGRRWGVNAGCARGASPVLSLPDGRLLFASLNGIVLVDSRRVYARIPDSIPAVFQASISGVPMQVSGQTFSGNARRLNNLTIDFHYFDLWNQDDLHYEYMLEGHETSWRQMSNVGAIQYFDVLPGTYTFRIRAVHPSSGLSSPEAIAVVTLIPRLHHRSWFWWLLVSITGIGILYLFRRDLLKRRQALLLHQRNNIIRDLHDDLGGSLASMTLTLRQIQLPPDAAQSARRLLKQAKDLASQQSMQFRDGLWLLSANAMTASQIAGRMRRFLNQCETDMSIVFSSDTASHTSLILVHDVKNIYLIFKEAVFNAIFHSHGTQVVIQFQCTPNSLVLAVQDNGDGTTPFRDSEGMGIRNMKSRTAELNGQLTIACQAEGGISIRLMVPFNKNR